MDVCYFFFILHCELVIYIIVCGYDVMIDQIIKEVRHTMSDNFGADLIPHYSLSPFFVLVH